MLLGPGCMPYGGVVSMVGCLGIGSGDTSRATYHSFGCFTRIRASASRHDLRQEPYAVVPHVRICAGGGEQSSSLPRPMHKPLLDVLLHFCRAWWVELILRRALSLLRKQTPDVARPAKVDNHAITP